MIRTVIVDDEIDAIRVLTRLLEDYCPGVSIVGTASGVETALPLIRSMKPDLLLLDIEMAQGNAFDLLNELLPFSFKVIFVTAFDNYAIRAFKYSAVDYLLKPVDLDDLRDAIDRIASLPAQNTVLQQMQTLLDNVGTMQIAQRKIAIPTITGLNFISLQDIVRFEAKGSYTCIHLDGEEPVMATRTVSEYEELLPSSVFFRIHNSHIINLTRIKKYHKGRGGTVEMEDGTMLEVASRRRDEFLRLILK